MALKKGTAAADTATAAAAAASKFEGMEEGTEAGTDTAAVETAAATQTPAATNATGTTADLTPASADDLASEVQSAAAPKSPAVTAEATAEATTTALTQVKNRALALGGNSKKFVGALSNLENVFDPAQLDFNTFPRIVVGLDGFTDDSDVDLGKEIGLEVLSFNTRFTVSPGVDSEEAKQHVRFSLDGKTLDCPTNPAEHGMPVAAYLDILRNSMSYENASMKEYVSIYGFLTYKNDAPVDPTEREIVGLQVPPQSRALFDRYKINAGLLQSRGLAPKHAGIRCQQEKVSGGGRKYAQIKFAAEKDKSIIDTFFKDEDEAAAA